MRRVASHGVWKSPIGIETLATGWIGLHGLAVDRGNVVWLEMRPTEGGRGVLVHRSQDGAVADLTPRGFDVGTAVYEYGGGAFIVQDGSAWFSNACDGRVYRQSLDGGPPIALTPPGPFRYADPARDPARHQTFWVREDHSTARKYPSHSIVAVPDTFGAPEVSVAGSDFYAFPRLSLDGTRIAWIQWNAPNMPWDGTELWVASLDRVGGLTDVRLLAGGPRESVLEPTWSPDGHLWFVSDRSGWWNLHRETENGDIEAVAAIEAEFAGPFWQFGVQSFAFADGERMVCRYNQNGQWNIGRLDISAGRFERLDLPYTVISHVHAAPHGVWFLGAETKRPLSVVELDLDDGCTRVLRSSVIAAVDDEYLPEPEAVEYVSESERAVSAVFFPPTSPAYRAPEGELPPLIVSVHGGPHNQMMPDLQLDLIKGAPCYWTSRGFAVVAVNYGGSTGYGRESRERLRDRWGIVDVADSVNAALALVDRGLVDGDRLAIRGTSAGGYTVLCAIASYDVFHVACSYFGLTELDVYAAETHKFEASYLDGLVPRAARQARSPVNLAARITTPVLIQQGARDKVVPPDQAELMVNALRERDLPCGYVLHEDEGHGFCKAESLQRSAEAELTFYLDAFGLSPVSPDDDAGDA